MKIKRITIENLLSFKKSVFNFKKYNVIVGPNNSGKTNLLRILTMLRRGNLLGLKITQKMKYEEGKKSQIKLEIEITDKEIRLILQAMLNQYISPETPLGSWKNFTIMLNWSNLGNNLSTEKIILYFQNGIAIALGYIKHHIFYCHAFGAENPEQYVDSLGNLSHTEIENRIEKNNAVRPIQKLENIGLVTSTDLSVFFQFEGKKRVIVGQSIRYNEQVHILELLDYMRLDVSGRPHISQADLVSKIIQRGFIQAEETRPTYQQITEKLFELKSQNELAYASLQRSFKKIFIGTEFKVEQSSTENKKKTTWISENQKTFDLDNSASGYLGILYLLYKILNNTCCSIFLDEPEIHLHPVKIKQISQELQSLTKNSDNQIIIISHSPKFVDRRSLDPNSSFSLTVVTKNEDGTSVSSPENRVITLKPHLLDPDVFFGRAVFLVEGSSDKSVISAISDNFGGFFNQYEIIIVNCEGVDNMNPYIELLDAYSITHYGLADKEYDDTSSNIVKLDAKLETELLNIMPEIEAIFIKNKIKSNDAYCCITDLLMDRDGFEKLKKTKIWKSVENVIRKQAIDTKIFDERYSSVPPNKSARSNLQET